MNNIKYYNDSLAYDFEMFMPKEAKKAEPQPKDNIVVMKLDDQITDEDLEFVKFMNKVRFCTKEQAQRFANGIEYENINARIDFLYKTMT